MSIRLPEEFFWWARSMPGSNKIHCASLRIAWQFLRDLFLLTLKERNFYQEIPEINVLILLEQVGDVAYWMEVMPSRTANLVS